MILLIRITEEDSQPKGREEGKKKGRTTTEMIIFLDIL